MSHFSAPIDSVDPYAGIEAFLRQFGLRPPHICTYSSIMPEGQRWREQRAIRVERLADSLHHALVAPDGGRRISLTGSLVGWSSLRTTRSKEAFRVIVQASFLEGDHVLQNDVVRGRRFWTKKTVEEAIRRLVKRNKLCPPTGPGFEWNAWFKDQSSLVHKLCQRASRNRLGSMDELQTVPFEEEDQISFKFHVAYLTHFQ